MVTLVTATVAAAAQALVRVAGADGDVVGGVDSVVLQRPENGSPRPLHAFLSQVCLAMAEGASQLRAILLYYVRHDYKGWFVRPR